jgi:hypothetical protein
MTSEFASRSLGGDTSEIGSQRRQTQQGVGRAAPSLSPIEGRRVGGSETDEIQVRIVSETVSDGAAAVVVPTENFIRSGFRQRMGYCDAG